MSLDKYRRVEKPREQESIQPNEIRITTQGQTRKYITYATNMLNPAEAKEGEEKPPQSDTIILKAMGRAINKTVTIAEIVKRRVAGLHQTTQIDSTEITDEYEPLEEGLDKVERTRQVSSVVITLSKNALDTSHPGYQPPIDASEVKPQDQSAFRGGRGRGRGRGRGGRGAAAAATPASPAPAANNNEGEAAPAKPAGATRGRGGRGRGRGGRGRGRGRGRGGAAAPAASE